MQHQAMKRLLVVVRIQETDLIRFKRRDFERRASHIAKQRAANHVQMGSDLFLCDCATPLITGGMYEMNYHFIWLAKFVTKNELLAICARLHFFYKSFIITFFNYLYIFVPFCSSANLYTLILFVTVSGHPLFYYKCPQTT